MIGMLTGKILECSPDRIVLDVSGVGYTLQIPLSTYYVLSAGSDPVCSLQVHTHVREDALQLFGFASRDERSAFEQLIAISGVGPRMALAILSGIGVDDLRQAVSGKDRRRLEKIPGVGKKTADRVLLELADKLARIPDAGGAEPSAAAAHAEPQTTEDACSALVNLGYRPNAAERAVNGALAELGRGTALEDLLKAALARLAR